MAKENVLKNHDGKFRPMKPVKRKKFYAVLEIGEKSVVVEAFGTRMEAKRELLDVAKREKGKLSHFGAFLNS